MITLEKLTEVCGRLNESGVDYVLIGGFAIFLHGYERTTQDIDLLVEPSADNIGKIKNALADILPEACSELEPDDVVKNVVVRMVGGELVVDLMWKVGDLDFEKVSKKMITEDIDGVGVPIPDVDMMIELKRGVRETDKKDYLFLQGKKEYLERARKG